MDIVGHCWTLLDIGGHEGKKLLDMGGHEGTWVDMSGHGNNVQGHRTMDMVMRNTSIFPSGDIVGHCWTLLDIADMREKHCWTWGDMRGHGGTHEGT